MLIFIPLVLALLMNVVMEYQQLAVTAETERTASTQQRAIQTVTFMNAMNDYLYDHPLRDGSIPQDKLPVRPPENARHIVRQGRAYIWQPFQPGLLYELALASDISALVGKVDNGQLHDVIGADMQVDVPSDIPDGTIVYMN